MNVLHSLTISGPAYKLVFRFGGISLALMINH